MICAQNRNRAYCVASCGPCRACCGVEPVEGRIDSQGLAGVVVDEVYVEQLENALVVVVVDVDVVEVGIGWLEECGRWGGRGEVELVHRRCSWVGWGGRALGRTR